MNWDVFWIVLGGVAGGFAVLAILVWLAVWLDMNGSTGWWVFGPFLVLLVIGLAIFAGMNS